MIFKLFKRKKDGQERLKKEIMEFGFTNPDELIKLIQPAILISEQSGNCQLGISKYGGQADLPKEINWPSFNNEAMVFIGQINLSELKELQSGLNLPKIGLLSFFIHFKEPENEFGAEYDFEPRKEEFRVLYFDNLKNIERKVFPPNLFDDYRFEEIRMVFSQDFQVPPTEESSYVSNSNMDETDKGLIYDFTHRYDDGFLDQIGGYPVPVQQGVDLDWASAIIEKQEDKFEKSYTLGKDFVNLFSFTLSSNFEVIGDSNCYFGITQENLNQMNFDETILIIQDT